ncbi:MAG: transglycosylase SLT domain-containing protein [Azoarcus sp.]|nr:transglycosylase SLT domain-containing protein [Azoarcus sp.]
MAKLRSLIFFFALLLPLPNALGSDSTDTQSSPVAPAPTITDTLPPRVLTLDLTRDANDIWDRIRRGYGMPDLDSDLVAEQQLFYLNRPSFLKQVFLRGGRYLYYIVDELERRGMPTELALLPMVESSYNPLAYSRAHASGLWQFIPSTGRHYNLTQDTWVDERRDVIASTNAALDYLQTIYEMHGDWHLALASYNWGEGSVGRALQRNRDAGLPTEYSQLRMPDETRYYVPKLQAIKNIVAEPELFHFELPHVANEQHFVTLAAPAGIDLATAAQFADMSIEEFLALNPGFNRPAITNAGQTLVVPADRATRFETRLNEFQLSGKGWRIHELEAGEKLETVATRHGLTLAQLMQLNGLATGSRLSAGYALLVPEGIDPSGALRVSKLLPGGTRLIGAPAVRLNTANIPSTKTKAANGQAKKKAPVKKPAAKSSAKKAPAQKAPAKPAATQAKKPK